MPVRAAALGVLRSRRFQNTTCGFLGALVGVALSAMQIDDPAPPRQAQIRLNNVPAPLEGLGDLAAGPSPRPSGTSPATSAPGLEVVEATVDGGSLPDPARVFNAFSPACAPSAVGATGSYRYRNTGYWLEAEDRATYPDEMTWRVESAGDGRVDVLEPQPAGRSVRSALHVGPSPAGGDGALVTMTGLTVHAPARTMRFKPVTPITFMDLSDDASWTSTGSDPATGAVAVVTGRVASREQVRVCGTDLLGFRVELTFRLVDSLGAVIVESGAGQPDNYLVTAGGIVLRRFVDTTTTSSDVTTRLVAFSALESIR